MRRNCRSNYYLIDRSRRPCIVHFDNLDNIKEGIDCLTEIGFNTIIITLASTSEYLITYNYSRHPKYNSINETRDPEKLQTAFFKYKTSKKTLTSDQASCTSCMHRALFSKFLSHLLRHSADILLWICVRRRPL